MRRSEMPETSRAGRGPRLGGGAAGKSPSRRGASLATFTMSAPYRAWIASRHAARRRSILVRGVARSGRRATDAGSAQRQREAAQDGREARDRPAGRPPCHRSWPAPSRVAPLDAGCSASSRPASTSSSAPTTACSPCSPRTRCTCPSACGSRCPRRLCPGASSRATRWSSGPGGSCCRRTRSSPPVSPGRRVCVPRAGLPTPADAARLPDPGVLGDLTRDLTTTALAGRRLDAAVRGLVGAGRGLTPSGDDALCGVLLALASVEHPDAARALAARAGAAACRCSTARRASRPRSSSAAASGYAVPDVVRSSPSDRGRGRGGVERPDATPPRPAWRADVPVRSGPSTRDPTGRHTTSRLEAVLAIGHTSGRDLLSGVSGALLALAHSLDPGPTTPPPEGAHRA